MPPPRPRRRSLCPGLHSFPFLPCPLFSPLVIRVQGRCAESSRKFGIAPLGPLGLAGNSERAGREGGQTWKRTLRKEGKGCGVECGSASLCHFCWGERRLETRGSFFFCLRVFLRPSILCGDVLFQNFPDLEEGQARGGCRRVESSILLLMFSLDAFGQK